MISMSSPSGSSASTSSETMVLEPNGDTVPLAIFPPGMDFSGMTIIEPSTGKSVKSSQLVTADNGGTLSPDGVTGNGSTGTGFYRVVRDGTHMYGVTNGAVWSGQVKIPLEVANPYGTLMSISIDAVDPNTGNRMPVGGSAQSGPFTYPVATVDTTQMSNGTYNLVAYAESQDTNDNEWDAYSPPFSVTTSNEITFENSVFPFGQMSNSLFYTATSAHTNVNWTVNIYDSSNNYVTTIESNSPDGNISFTWDLTDTNGVAHTNDTFFTAYVSTPYTSSPQTPGGAQPAYSGQGTPSTFWKYLDTWTASGQWVIVVQRMLDPYNFSDANVVYYEFDDENLADGGWWHAAGGNGGLNPYTPSYHDPSDNTTHAYQLEYGADAGAADTEWQNLRKALFSPSSRNFVYFGHGTPRGIGSEGSADTNRFISASEIANALGNVYSVGGVNNLTNMHHGYRFAFVDACDTASGPLCFALGILPGLNVPLQTYGGAGLRPGTFCGWPDPQNIGYIVANDVNYDHVHFVEHFQFNMLYYGQPVYTSYANASNEIDDPSMANNDMAIYGYWGLTEWSYNTP